MEHLLVALWRAPAADATACHATVRDEWAPVALADDAVRACAVSFAIEDQGPYTKAPDSRGLVPNCDVLLALGLDRAHDLDDVPARDLLHGAARRLEVWRVDPRHPIEWERTWPDGEMAPGIKMVSFVRRAEALTHEQFVRHWTEQHAPLARAHHLGLWNYTQNVVRRAYTPGGNPIDGIAELQFRSREDFETKFYDSDEGKAAIRADVKRFIAGPSSEAALMVELPLRTPTT